MTQHGQEASTADGRRSSCGTGQLPCSRRNADSARPRERHPRGFRRSHHSPASSVLFGRCRRRRGRPGRPTDVRAGEGNELFDPLLIAAAAPTRGLASVIGVAVPGVVQEPDGRLGSIPELGRQESRSAPSCARHVDPGDYRERRQALAVGELHRGAAQGVSNLVAVVLETGLGTGIITNGKSIAASGPGGRDRVVLIDRSALGKMFPQRGIFIFEPRLGSVAMTRQAREQGMSIPDAELLSAGDSLPWRDRAMRSPDGRRGIPRHPVAGGCGDRRRAESGARRARWD